MLFCSDRGCPPALSDSEMMNPDLLQWFPMQVRSQQERSVRQSLERYGVEVFLTPMAPGLLFVHSSLARLASLKAALPELRSLHYVMTPSSDRLGQHDVVTIDDSQMQSLIIATNAHDENVIRLSDRTFTLKSPDEVEVIAGKFKGVRGKLIRARRQQRILIELAGFMTFATAYVPTDFIRKI